jgi:serine/threonine protein kinase
MAKVSVEKFLELFRRTGLVEDPQLAETLGEITEQCDGSLPATSEELADRIVAAGLLSRWQADNLLQGKHKGFFLGRYKLLGHLGRGGMSNVYLAEHVMMKRRVAIKVLPQNKVEDSSYLARFKLETQAAAKLDHPNIVRAFDTDHEGNTYYLVMEYVDGVDLQAMVQKKGPLDFDTAADYIAQVAQGLQHAHDSGLVHRDIKPANCLVNRKETAKLLDMGLAKFSADDAPSLTLAHDENVLGTADYLSPEQALNSHTVDLRADIYSLGCTLYFLLTGHPPFPEGTLPQRLMMHQTKSPTSIYKERPDAPRELVDICSRMMVKSPDGRFQSASEVSDELTAYLALRGKVAHGGPGSSGSGVLAAAAQEANLRAGGGSSSSTAKRRRPPAAHDASLDSDTLSLVELDATGPNGSASLDLVDDTSSIQLISTTPTSQKTETGATSDRAATANGSAAPASTDTEDDDAQELITSVDEELDLDDVMLGGMQNKSWPSTSAIAERKRRDKNRVNPSVWIAASAGGLILLLLIAVLVVALF